MTGIDRKIFLRTLSWLWDRGNCWRNGGDMTEWSLWHTLWLLVLLISVSICCGMSRWVPFIHGSQRGSLFFQRACTKLSRSCVTQISIMRSITSWSLNPSTFFCNSITLFFWETVRIYLARSTTQLKSYPIQIYMYQTSSWASCKWSPPLLPSSQEICW